MTSLWKRVSALLCLALGVTLLLGGCDPAATPLARPANARPQLVATIVPLASLTTQLAGDWADVQTLVPGGVTPHGFELSANQVRELANADLLITVGLNFDL